MLPKKRQSSKKSAPLLSSKAAPNIRSRLDNTGNTATDIIIEASDVTQLSAGFIPPTIRAADSLTRRSCDNFQARTSLVDDQDLAQTFPEDATCSVRTDLCHLPPPASSPTPPPLMDMCGILDSNAFSWPPFTTNSDWQFDFDIPIMAEHAGASRGASSATLPELDPYELFNRPTQGLGSTSFSRDLIEDDNTSEKVGVNSTWWLFWTLTRSRDARLELF